MCFNVGPQKRFTSIIKITTVKIIFTTNKKTIIRKANKIKKTKYRITTKIWMITANSNPCNNFTYKPENWEILGPSVSPSRSRRRGKVSRLSKKCFPEVIKKSCIHTTLFQLIIMKLYCHYFIYEYNFTCSLF